MKDDFWRQPKMISGLLIFMMVMAILCVILNPFLTWIFGSIIWNISVVNSTESDDKSIIKMGNIFFRICIAVGALGAVLKYILHLY